ncbi:TIGR03854 family LLM class F420-dependent oxidoreductase [Streptomyces sp. NPDC051597]|uniref:TIGR03854 family LLM class F420-dependent oxidoreductase n=1 Tax=Streptomyces sp. NPDC051597 TaxID=3155049 RepID=UPI003426E75D
MKVRIGVGSVPERAARPDRPDLGALVADAEAHGIDSVWFSDLVSAPDTLDPLVAVAHAAAVTTRLKLGMGVLVLPGRNPALVAAQLASLTALAPGRVLPVFGVRPARRPDRTMYPVPAGRRAAVFEEALKVVRALLTQRVVTHHGQFFHLEEASVPRPTRALDLWLSGRVPVALDRIGRLGDGWLGSNIGPPEAEACRARIVLAAERANRTIDEDHYGMYLTVVQPDTDSAAVDALLTRLRQDRPDVPDPRTLLCWGWSDARAQLRRYIDTGLSKFVIRPAGPVTSRQAFLEEFTAILKPLESEA